MRSLLLLLLAMPLAFFSSCSNNRTTAIQSESVSAHGYKNSFLVDVRTPQEFAAGSVPGAVNIPVDEIEGRLDAFKGKESIVLFCRSGARSGKAKSILESHGIQNITNGGSWQEVNRVIKGN